MTGAVTVTTLPSSISSSRALWQSSRTSGSGIGRHARSCAMALRRASARGCHRGSPVGKDDLPVQVTHVCDRTVAGTGASRRKLAKEVLEKYILITCRFVRAYR